MQFTLLNQGNQAYWEATYIEAFPEEERLPFDQLLTSSQAGKFHLFVIQEADENVGILLNSPIAPESTYVFFFAIDQHHRNQRLGSTVLALLKTRYPKGVLLESEEIGKNAANEAQREKRYQFYERNGVLDTGYLIIDRGLTFHIMFAGASGFGGTQLQFLLDFHPVAKIWKKPSIDGIR